MRIRPLKTKHFLIFWTSIKYHRYFFTLKIQILNEIEKIENKKKKNDMRDVVFQVVYFFKIIIFVRSVDLFLLKYQLYRFLSNAFVERFVIFQFCSLCNDRRLKNYLQFLFNRLFFPFLILHFFKPKNYIIKRPPRCLATLKVYSKKCIVCTQYTLYLKS